MAKRKISILCIDDDPFYVALYRQILATRKEFSVTSAASAEDGYARLKKRLPDLVILDVMLPEKGKFRDGYGLLERLRQESATKKLPVLMVSALGGPEDAKHGLALGASSYLPKQDMMPHRLISEIEKALER